MNSLATYYYHPINIPTEREVFGYPVEVDPDPPVYVISTVLCGSRAGMTIVSESGLKHMAKQEYHDIRMLNKVVRAMGFENDMEYAESYPGKFNVRSPIADAMPYQRPTIQEPVVSMYGTYVTYNVDIMSTQKLSNDFAFEFNSYGYATPTVIYPTIYDVERAMGKKASRPENLWFCEDWSDDEWTAQDSQHNNLKTWLRM